MECFNYELYGARWVKVVSLLVPVIPFFVFTECKEMKVIKKRVLTFEELQVLPCRSEFKCEESSASSALNYKKILMLQVWKFSHVWWLKIIDVYYFHDLKKTHIVRFLKCCISSLTIFVFRDWLYFTLYPKWKFRGVARKFSEGDRNMLKYVSLTNYQGGGESSSDLFLKVEMNYPAFLGKVLTWWALMD